MKLLEVFGNLFKKSEKRQSVEEREAEFKALSVKEQQKVVDKLLAIRDDEAYLAEVMEKEPYLLSYIIGRLKDTNCIPLIDIATKNGASVYDLIDKNDHIHNATIVNIACINQPELILELEDMQALQDLVTSDTVIKVFVKNPMILLSSCRALDSKIKVEGTKKDGSKIVRYASLRNQLLRAINIHSRPKCYMGNGLDRFAKSIADKIEGSMFDKKLSDNRMITRSTTAINETLKKSPEKGKVVPAKALQRWNNRVLYIIPSEARKMIKKDKAYYDIYREYLFGYLSNASMNSLSEETVTKLVKRCVSIVPDLYFDLEVIEEVDYSKIAKQLTVQLSAYEAYKAMHDKKGAEFLLESLTEAEAKKVLAKSKSNTTRKANKKSKQAVEEQTLTLSK